MCSPDSESGYIKIEIKDTMWIAWWPICVSLKSDQARILKPHY